MFNKESAPLFGIAAAVVFPLVHVTSATKASGVSSLFKGALSGDGSAIRDFTFFYCVPVVLASYCSYAYYAQHHSRTVNSSDSRRQRQQLAEPTDADGDPQRVVYTDERQPFPFYCQRDQVPEGMKAMTASDLAQFTGRDGQPAYVSVKGRIFDVSKSPMYQPAAAASGAGGGGGDAAKNSAAEGGGGYKCFVARDCSRAFATMSLKEADMRPSVVGLTANQLKTLDDWEKFYVKRYKQVGVLVES